MDKERNLCYDGHTQREGEIDMNTTPCKVTFHRDMLTVKGYDTRDAMGRAAAMDVAACLRRLLAEQETVNMIFAAAPSQNELLFYLCEQTDIAWERVNAFHMDEYIGLPENAPQRFAAFLQNAIFGKLPFKNVYTINACAIDAKEEEARYTALLKAHPVDIVCMGIGENGHIAFNDPGVADFNDPLTVKRAVLDEVCRTQQVHDGCFERLEDVPKEALTLTVPTLFGGKHLFCVVPAASKRAAVTAMLNGEITDMCPCTILRRHADATLYCDSDSLEVTV